jgi:hypothetical protein
MFLEHGRRMIKMDKTLHSYKSIKEILETQEIDIPELYLQRTLKEYGYSKFPESGLTDEAATKLLHSSIDLYWKEAKLKAISHNLKSQIKSKSKSRQEVYKNSKPPARKVKRIIYQGINPPIIEYTDFNPEYFNGIEINNLERSVLSEETPIKNPIKGIDSVFKAISYIPYSLMIPTTVRRLLNEHSKIASSIGAVVGGIASCTGLITTARVNPKLGVYICFGLVMTNIISGGYEGIKYVVEKTEEDDLNESRFK